MPIYEFRCRKCHHVFEALCRMGDDGSDRECPECGVGRPERLPSIFAAATGKPAGLVRGGSACSGCSKTSCRTCGP
jgi:putative FmdB family regulatory protein